MRSVDEQIPVPMEPYHEKKNSHQSNRLTVNLKTKIN